MKVNIAKIEIGVGKDNTGTMVRKINQMMEAIQYVSEAPIDGGEINPDNTDERTNQIKLRRGLRSELSAETLAGIGEPIICEDTGEMFVKTTNGFVRMLAPEVDIDGGDFDEPCDGFVYDGGEW